MADLNRHPAQSLPGTVRLIVRAAAAVLLSLPLVLSATGCENTIEPFAETTRHFAIYGFLDADVDTQFVRIEPTRPLPDLNTPTEFQIAEVRTTDLTTGDVVIWNESTIELEDGASGLVYWAVFRPTVGHPHTIEVIREDGASSRATSVIPDLSEADIRKPNRTFAGTYEQVLVLADVTRRPESITMNYEVTLQGDDGPQLITLDYNVFGAPIRDGWQIEVRLTRDRERVLARLGVPPATVLRLHHVSMTMRLLTADWPLVEADDRTNNVEDGFGFFGAAATHRLEWRVDSLVVRELGYEDGQGELATGS